jgi:N-acetylglucosamine-6-phosphate deacetylase
VICDGLHVDPAAVRLLLKVKGVERTVLVTDIAQIGTAGGGLVGSSIHLDEAVRNVVNWGAATFPEAIRMATLNAAAAVSLEDKLGRLAVGRNADICVWDKRTLAVKHVIANGQLLA